MAHRGPVRIMLAFRPGHPGDLGLEHCLHHRHPGGHAHRQQPLPRGTGDIGHRQLDLLRQIRQHHGIGRVSETNSRYGLHGGPFLRGCTWSFTRRPTIRQASGEGPPPQIPRRTRQPPETSGTTTGAKPTLSAQSSAVITPQRMATALKCRTSISPSLQMRRRGATANTGRTIESDGMSRRTSLSSVWSRSGITNSTT